MKHNIYCIPNSTVLYGYIIELSTHGQYATCIQFHRLDGKDTWEFGGIHEELVSSLKSARDGEDSVYRYLGAIEDTDIINALLPIFQERDSGGLHKFEFVSYDGDYPNLCSGTLVFKVDGKEYSFDHILESGGSVEFDENWNEHVSYGPWSIREYNLPDELKGFRKEITELVNDNVSFGCCGGCI